MNNDFILYSFKDIREHLKLFRFFLSVSLDMNILWTSQMSHLVISDKATCFYSPNSYDMSRMQDKVKF